MDDKILEIHHSQSLTNETGIVNKPYFNSIATKNYNYLALYIIIVLFLQNYGMSVYPAFCHYVRLSLCPELNQIIYLSLQKLKKVWMRDIIILVYIHYNDLISGIHSATKWSIRLPVTC